MILEVFIDLPSTSISNHDLFKVPVKEYHVVSKIISTKFLPPLISGRNIFYLFFIFGLFFTPVVLEAAAAALVIALLFFLFQKPTPHFRLVHYLIVGYFLSAIITFLLSGQTKNELSKFLPHFILLSYLPLSIWAHHRKDLQTKRWILWIITAATFAALAGIINHFLGKDRTTTTFGGYFTLAALMSWSLPLSVGLFLQTETRRIYGFILILLAQLLALWWTFTRSAFLGLFIGFGIWFVIAAFLKRSIKKPDIAKWIISFSLPLILLLLIFFSRDQRINPFSPSESSSSSTVDLSSGRKGIILDAISILKADLRQMNAIKLLFGHGLSSYRRLVESPWASWESDYLEIMMNQGLAGLIIILSLYFYFLKAVWKGLQSHSLLTNGVAISGIIFWVMSFFTLKLVSWHSGGIFLITLLLLEHAPSPPE